MIVFRRTAAAFALATVLFGALPAEAQWRRGYGYGYGHRRGGGDTVGNLLLGGLIGGAIVGVATAGSRNRTVERVGDPLPPVAPLPAPPIAPPGEYDLAAAPGAGSRGEAVDVCTAAAEDGARARVQAITHVEQERDGWRVDGRVDDGAHPRDGGRFTCASARGKVLEFRYQDALAGPAY